MSSNIYNLIGEAIKGGIEPKSININKIDSKALKEVFDCPELLKELEDEKILYLLDVCAWHWFCAEMSDDYSTTLREQLEIPLAIVKSEAKNRNLDI